MQIAGELESRFKDGIYIGYEVKLLIQRDDRKEPYPIKSARDIAAFMAGLGNESSEHIYELMLDVKHRVCGVYLVGKGSSNMTPADPREVFKAALCVNSPAFALVHNHPSGVVEPSPDDKSLVQRVQQGAAVLGLEFLDFVIVGGSQYFSFLDAGMLLK